MNLELRGLAPKLKVNLESRIENEGPIGERELWGWAIEFFAPQLKISTANLIKNYKMLYGRKVGNKTAELNILNNLRILLSSVKKELPHTEKKIILGKQHIGRIFYTKGQEPQIRIKIRQLIDGTGSRAEEILKELKRGPFPIKPPHKKAAKMLEYYNLIDIRKIGTIHYAVQEGQIGVVNLKTEENKDHRFPISFRIWKPFSAGTWILKDGPVQKTIKFDIAAWDPTHRIFYVGLIKKYVSQRDVSQFKEKLNLLHLPAKMIIFCGTISKESEKYANSWGIEIKVSE